MKKVFLLVIALCCSLGVWAQVSKTVNLTTAGTLSATLSAAELTTVTNLTLTGEIDARDFKTMRDGMTALSVIDLSGATIVAYTGADGTSATVTSYVADAIPDEAFLSKKTLSSFVAPASTTEIKQSAFKSCTALTSALSFSSLVTVGKDAFYDVPASIFLPASTTGLINMSFSYARGNITVDANNPSFASQDGVLFNKDVTTLIHCPRSKTGDYIIPATVTMLDNNAFSWCMELKSVFIPASVKSISANTFPRAAGTIIVDANNGYYSSNDGVLFNKSQTELLHISYSRTGTYVVPSTVTTIKTYAFYESSTSGIIIPSSVTTIEAQAFRHNQIASLNLPNSVTSIGSGAFTGSFALSGSLVIPSSINELSSSVFSECAKITSLVIPSSVTKIGNLAFASCTGLKCIYAYNPVPVVLPVSSTNDVFNSTPKTIPLYVPYDSKTAYAAANQWKDFTNIVEMFNVRNIAAGTLSATFTKAQKDTLTKLTLTGTIDARDFKTMRDSMPALTTVDLSGATIVEYSGTLGTNGTSDQTYAANTIPASAFDENHYPSVLKLQNIILGNSITAIGNMAFYLCSTLKTITLPQTLTSISDWAFQGTKIPTLTIPASVSSLGFGVFTWCSTTITVDPASPSFVCVDGVLYDKAKEKTFYCPTSKNGNFIVPNTVKEIGAGSFAQSTLTSVTLPKSVFSIQDYAFQDVNNLTVYIYNPAVISVNSVPFHRATAVTAYVLSGSKAAYQANAVWNAITIKEMDIANNPTNKALDFDGVDDYVSLPAGNYFTGTSLTVEGWVYLKGVTQSARLVEFGEKDGVDNIICALSGGTDGKPYIGVFNGALYSTHSASTTLPPNQWVHLAYVVNGKNAIIYMNGNIILDVTVAQQFRNIVRNNNFIGRSNWVNDGYSKAIFDEVRIWNTARTQDEIRVYMGKPIPNPTSKAGLVAYYNFDQGVPSGINTSETRLTDGSFFKNHGALNNFMLAGSASNWVNGPFLYETYSGLRQIPVETTGTWSVSESSSWITALTPATATSTTGNGNIGITLDENYADEVRTTNLLVTCNGTTQTIPVVQTPNAIKLTPLSTTIAGADGSTLAYEIEAAGSWTISFPNTTWLTRPNEGSMVGGGNSSEIVRAAANLNTTSRTGTIQVCAWSGASCRSFTINQTAGYPLTVSSSTVDIPSAAAGATATATITTNAVWTASSNQTWLTLSAASGAATTGTTLTFTATANTTTVPRTATVTVISNSTTKTITVTQAAPYVAVPAGNNALAFDGVDDYVEVQYSSAINPSSSFTVEAMFFCRNYTSDFQSIITSRSAIPAYGYIVYLHGPTKKLAFWTGNGSWSSISSPEINLNQWYHIAVRYANNTMSMFLDGVEVASVTGITFQYQISNPLRIGAGKTEQAATYFFNGSIDEVRIWNTARTLEEIQASKNTSITTPTDGLVANYSFNQGVPMMDNSKVISLSDASGNASDGLLKNFALKGSTSNWAVGAPLNNPHVATEQVLKTGRFTKAYSVASNTTWAATSDMPWVNIVQSVTAGNGTLTLSVSTPNPTIIARTAIVTIAAAGAISQTILLTQAAGDATLSITTTSYTVPNKAITKNFTVVSNTNFSAESSDATWLTTTLSGLNVQMSAATNMTTATRTATVTVSTTSGTPTQTQTITVTQAAGDTVFSVSDKIHKYTANALLTDSLKVTCNANLQALTKASWLQISFDGKAFNDTAIQSLNKLTQQQVWIVADTNKTLVARKDTIWLSSGTHKKAIVVEQDAAIGVKSFSDTSIYIGKTTNEYVFANIFNYINKDSISYKVSFSQSGIVNYVAVNSSTDKDSAFALLSRRIGTTRVSIKATTAWGTFAETSFALTVKNNTCFKVDSVITPVVCAGDSTGRIVVKVSGGAKPYIYEWSNYSTNDTVRNLASGTYTVKIIDSLGCQIDKTYYLPQTNPIKITEDITPPSICDAADGAITLTVSGGNGSYQYKWDDGSVQSTLTNKKNGDYIVTVTDATSCKVSKSIHIFDKDAPKITVNSIKPSLCKKATGSIDISVANNNCTILWSNTSKEEDQTNLLPAKYWVKALLGTCKDSIAITVPYDSIPKPELSLVTLDSSFTHNLVVWMREKTDAIDFYQIYRDSNWIANVPYNQISVYKDTSSLVKPYKQSYMYQISALNTCGSTSRSNIFKTIHLQAYRALDNSANELRWEDYGGSVRSRKYIVYRKDGSAWKKIDSLVNGTGYSDKIQDKALYYVAIDLPFEVRPTLFKTDTGPFSQSFSNMSEASLVDEPILIPTTRTANLVLQPNPANTVLKISLNDARLLGAVTAITLDGTRVQLPIEVADQYAIVARLDALAAGVYTLEVQSNVGVLFEKLVVIK